MTHIITLSLTFVNTLLLLSIHYYICQYIITFVIKLSQNHNILLTKFKNKFITFYYYNNVKMNTSQINYDNVDWFNEPTSFKEKYELDERNEYETIHAENMYCLMIDLKRYINEQEFYFDNWGFYIGYDKNKYGVKKFWL